VLPPTFHEENSPFSGRLFDGPAGDSGGSPEPEPPQSARPPSTPGPTAPRAAPVKAVSLRSGSEGAQRPESLEGRAHGACMGVDGHVNPAKIDRRIAWGERGAAGPEPPPSRFGPRHTPAQASPERSRAQDSGLRDLAGHAAPGGSPAGADPAVNFRRISVAIHTGAWRLCASASPRRTFPSSRCRVNGCCVPWGSGPRPEIRNRATCRRYTASWPG
jgi:hypothetical protein